MLAGFPLRREKRLLPASPATSPVRLGGTVTGLDQRNVGLLVKAILHTSGQRQFPR